MEDVLILEVGTRVSDDAGEYSDIDMAFTMSLPPGFTHKDGTPYPVVKQRRTED